MFLELLVENCADTPPPFFFCICITFILYRQQLTVASC